MPTTVRSNQPLRRLRAHAPVAEACPPEAARACHERRMERGETLRRARTCVQRLPLPAWLTLLLLRRRRWERCCRCCYYCCQMPLLRLLAAAAVLARCWERSGGPR